MYQMIKKRDGRRVKFDARKITAAIASAGAETAELDEKIAASLTKKVIARLQADKNRHMPSVEDVQDVVEDVLLDSRYKKTAKAYIIYRDQHKKLRQIAASAHVDLVDNYVNNLDWKIKENSNMATAYRG